MSLAHMFSYRDESDVLSHYKRALEWHGAKPSDVILSGFTHERQPVQNTRDFRDVVAYTLKCYTKKGQGVFRYLTGDISRA